MKYPKTHFQCPYATMDKWLQQQQQQQQHFPLITFIL